MGDFLGHVIPGMILWMISLWWTTNVIRQYYSACRLGGKRYQAHFYYASAFVSQAPLESVLKIVAAVTLMRLEFITGFKDGQFINNVILQHVSMHLAFLINGVLEVLHHRRTALNKKIDQDRGMQQEPIGVLVFLATMTFLFHFHLHGRTVQDTLVHVLFVLTTLVVIVCILVETWHTNWVACSMLRVIAMQTCATWMTQIGFTLYPEFIGWHKWDGSDPMQCQFVLVLFLLHWIGNISFTIVFLSSAMRMQTPS